MKLLNNQANRLTRKKIFFTLLIVKSPRNPKISNKKTIGCLKNENPIFYVLPEMGTKIFFENIKIFHFRHDYKPTKLFLNHFLRYSVCNRPVKNIDLLVRSKQTDC